MDDARTIWNLTPQRFDDEDAPQPEVARIRRKVPLGGARRARALEDDRAQTPHARREAAVGAARLSRRRRPSRLAPRVHDDDAATVPLRELLAPPLPRRQPGDGRHQAELSPPRGLGDGRDLLARRRRSRRHHARGGRRHPQPHARERIRQVEVRGLAKIKDNTGDELGLPPDRAFQGAKALRLGTRSRPYSASRWNCERSRTWTCSSPRSPGFIQTVAQGDDAARRPGGARRRDRAGHRRQRALTDAALKRTRVVPGMQIVERAYGLLELHAYFPDQGEVRQAAAAILERLGVGETEGAARAARAGRARSSRASTPTNRP